jgi:hypothetical protein
MINYLNSFDFENILQQTDVFGLRFGGKCEYFAIEWGQTKVENLFQHSNNVKFQFSTQFGSCDLVILMQGWIP